MSPLLTILAFFINILSILFSVTSNSFVLIWFSMEISMFSFMIILLLHQHNLSNSHVVKYFMFQAFSSVILIISLSKSATFQDIMLLVALMKLGAAPFHMWFMGIVENLSLSHFFWMAVPQKIIPFRLIQIMSLPSLSFNKMLLISTFLAGLHMIIQFKFLKMFAASSVYITPWILFCFFSSDFISWLFFMSYSVIQLLVLWLFFKMKVKANPLSHKSSNMVYMWMMLLTLMMAGFPPSPLFFLKLSVLTYLFMSNMWLSGLILMFIASVTMFNYLNIIGMGVIASVGKSMLSI